MTTYSMQAQTKPASAVGDYQLEGVMEVASVFSLQPDSSFEFFFSYGALDRYGKGKWHLDEKTGQVILQSRTRPAADFALLQSSKQTNPQIRIKITDNNNMLLPYVYARVHTANGIVEGRTDGQGYFSMPKAAVTQIELIFELCPDRFTSFVVKAPGHNYFEFRFEPWIAEVFFDKFILQLEKQELVGGHPLLEPGRQYHYHQLGVRGSREEE